MKSLQESYGQARERVAGIREQEDEIAIKKAEATIEYAVSRLISHDMNFSFAHIF